MIFFIQLFLSTTLWFSKIIHHFLLLSLFSDINWRMEKNVDKFQELTNLRFMNHLQFLPVLERRQNTGSLLSLMQFEPVSLQCTYVVWRGFFGGEK